MFDQLSERLQGTFAKIGGKSLTTDNMDEALREVRRALLEADVNLRVIKAFISRIKDRAEGESVLKNVDPGQQLIKLVHDELVILLGKENSPLNTEGQPNIIMLFGLQGSGKTTSAGKLALKLQKEGRKPLLIAADVYRPAAINQLIALGQQIAIPVHTLEGSTDVQAIVKSGFEKAKAENHNTLIIDTAGRLQVDTDMMAELLVLERIYKPHEKLLVVDAMTGQEAVNVAETFNTQLEITGVILTKTDGDARGGAALSVSEITGKPIKFLGTSEKMEGLEIFHPERMATRILGMGDIVSLVEKAQQVIDTDEAKKLEEKIRKQDFSFEDFLRMQKQMKMLGGMNQILGMLPIPGLDKNARDMLAHGGETQMKRVEAMIQSMTVKERQNGDLLKNSGRIKRISKGCGLPETEIKQFVQQFEQMKMMMKQMTQMGDKTQKEQKKKQGFGLHMPRNTRKRKKKDKELGGGFPGMPGGGFPKFPGF